MTINFPSMTISKLEKLKEVKSLDIKEKLEKFVY